MPVIAGAQALSEDFTRVQNVIAGCTEAAALVIAHVIKGTPLNNQELYNLITGAQAAGQASIPGGSQTGAGAAWDLAHYGIGVQQYGNPGANLGNIINNALGQNKPVEVQVLQGNQLTGEPAGLHGHAITIVGQNSPGSYIVADPNTPQAASGGFVTDTLQQLQNAQPFQVTVPTSGGSGTQELGFNPIPDLSGIANILDPTAFQNAVQGGLTNAFTAAGNSLKKSLWSPFAGLGIGNLNDFLWRVLFIIGGIILIIIGLVALTKDIANSDAGATVAKVAAVSE